MNLPSFLPLSAERPPKSVRVVPITDALSQRPSSLRLIVSRRLHWYIADFLLGMMIVGPLIMPFFLQADSPTLNSVGALIHGIGQFICPQLSYSPTYGGMPFAVCYRCTAALFGLIIARSLHRPGGVMRDLGWKTRGLFLLLCVTWLTIEVQGTGLGWWPGIVPLMIVHGVIYGISVGGVVYAGLLALDRVRQPEPTTEVAL
jgi:hypothetical protein